MMVTCSHGWDKESLITKPETSARRCALGRQPVEQPYNAGRAPLPSVGCRHTAPVQLRCDASQGGHALSLQLAKDRVHLAGDRIGSRYLLGGIAVWLPVP